MPSIEEQMLQRMTQVLTPQEFQILDRAITPEVGAIVLKAFPDLAPVITLLVQDDVAGGQMAPQAGAALGGGAPMPMMDPMGPAGQGGY